MRKQFFLASATLATLLLAGCANEVLDEAHESRPISFENAFVDKSTRATQTTAADPSSTESNLEAFKVYGYQDETLLFDGTDVRKSGSDWTYSPTKYWVTGSNYYFMALAGLNQASVSTVLNSTTVTATITEFTNDTGKADLIASTQSTVTSATQNQDAVGLTFKHQLSKVKFTFVNGFTANDDVYLLVKDVTITDAYKTAKVEITGGVPTWSDQTTDSAIDLVFGATDKIAPSNGQDEASQSLLLIPSKSSDEKTYNITFSVDVYANAGTTLTATYPHTVTLSGANFEAGKSYNLTATLTSSNVNADEELNPIEFELTTVDSWETASGISVEVSATK